MTIIECLCGDGPCKAIEFLETLTKEQERAEQIIVKVTKNYLDSGECIRSKELKSHLLELKHKASKSL